jgi:hypothetical protein
MHSIICCDYLYTVLAKLTYRTIFGVNSYSEYGSLCLLSYTGMISTTYLSLTNYRQHNSLRLFDYGTNKIIVSYISLMPSYRMYNNKHIYLIVPKS